MPYTNLALFSFSFISLHTISLVSQQQPDELHYAELSISLSRNYNTSSSKSVTTTTTANYDTLGANSTTLPKKPPAYDYFNEPTVYAQIDHFKTLPSATAPSTSMASSTSASKITSNAYQMSAPTHQPQHVDNSPNVGQNSCGGSNGTLSNSNTLTFSSIQSPSSSTASYQTHNQYTTTSSKPFSREIVTIRTPLLYTQQESCV